MNVDELRQLTAGPRRPLLEQALGLCVPQQGPRGAGAALDGLAHLYPDVVALREAEQFLDELVSSDLQRTLLAARPQLKSDPVARYLAI